MTTQSVVEQAKELEGMGYTRDQIVALLGQPAQVQVGKPRRPFNPEALEHEVFDYRAAKEAQNPASTYPAKAARIVGAPEATIRTRVFHGKRKLRELLEKEELG